MLTQEHKIWAYQRRLYEHIQLLGELGFKSATAVELMRDLVAVPQCAPVRLANQPVSNDTEEVIRPIVHRCLGCGQRISSTKRVCRACWDDLQRRIAEEKASKNVDKTPPVHESGQPAGDPATVPNS